VGELQALPGIGLAKAASLVAALSLERLVRAPSLSQVVTGPQVIYEACGDILTHPQEHLLVFFLNVRTGILRRELVSVGTATASLVHPREVFRAAITYNAHSIILAHNHPSGDPAPSAADYAVTKRVAKAGSELGIELLDHIICASGAYVSLKEHRPSLFL
jgi:DNA repair protein RadC